MNRIIKTIICTLFIVSFIFSDINAQPIDYLTEPVSIMDVPFIENVVIDGTKDAGYSVDNDVPYFALQVSGWTESDISGSFNLAYDCDNLYLFVNVVDDKLHVISEIDWYNPWTYDNIDFYFNPTVPTTDTGNYGDNTIALRYNPDSDTAFFFHSNWSLKSDYLGVPGFDTNYVFITKPGGDGYYLEASIPWEGLLPLGNTHEDLHNFEDTYMGFDLALTDSDGDPYTLGARETIMYWDDDDTGIEFAYNDVRKFGLIRLLSIGENCPAEIPDICTVDTVYIMDTTYVYDTVTVYSPKSQSYNIINVEQSDGNIFIQSALPYLKIELTNIYGETVLTANGSELKKQSLISTKNFAKGSYTINVFLENNLKVTQRINLK